MRSMLWILPLMQGCSFIPLVVMLSGSQDSQSEGWYDSGYDSGGWAPTGPEFVSRDLDWEGSVYTASEGVAVDHRSRAWIGMSSMVCAFDPKSSTITVDVDPNLDAPERVVGLVEEGDEVVSITPGYLHHVDPDGGIRSWRAPGLIDAQVIPGGEAVVTQDDDGCTFEADEPIGEVPDCPEPDGWAVDNSPPTVWTSNAEGQVTVLTPGQDGQPSNVVGDLLAFDREHDVLLAAWRRDDEVRAYRPDGALLWAVEVPGPVLRLRPMPAKAAVAVLIADGDARRVLQITYERGQTEELLQTDLRARDLVLSADARSVALITDEEVHVWRR